MNSHCVIKCPNWCGGENRVKGWTGMVPCYLGSVPRTDSLGNDPYIGIEPRCYPVVRFRNHQLEHSERHPSRFWACFLSIFLSLFFQQRVFPDDEITCI